MKSVVSATPGSALNQELSPANRRVRCGSVSRMGNLRKGEPVHELIRAPIRHTNRLQRHQSDGIAALDALCHHCVKVIHHARRCQAHLRAGNIAGEELKLSLSALAVVNKKRPR